MKITFAIACAFLAASLTVNVQAALPFTAGDLVVYRVGDPGDAAGTTAATDVWLDEYTEAGALVGSIEMPTSSGGGQYALTAQGGSTAEGFLTISPDEHWLALTGYGVAPGYATPSTASASTVNRVVGIVNAASGAVDTSTALTDASSTSSFRSAITTDGSSLWIDGGAGGARYTTKGATTSIQLETATTNLRQIEIYPTASQTGGQLMISSASGSTRLDSVGTGLPTTSGQSLALLPGTTATSPSGPYAFVQLTLGNGSVPDTMYVADDGTSQVQKWSLVSGNWTMTGSEAVSAPRGIVACPLIGGGIGVFVTAGASSGNGITNILEFVDMSGYDGTFSSGTNTLVQLPVGEQFRGIVQLTLVPEPTTLALVGVSLLGLFAIRRRRS